MAFKKTGKGMYKSSSGRSYTGKRVRVYYATKGLRRKPEKRA